MELTLCIIGLLALASSSSEDQCEAGSDGPNGCKKTVGSVAQNISVLLTIYTDIPPQSPTTPAVNQTVLVPQGSFLVDALDKGEDEEILTYDYILQKYGIYITEMEGVAADDSKHQYWALLNATWNRLPTGASCYQLMKDMEQILFQIQTW